MSSIDGDGRDDRVVPEVADEPPHRHVLLPGDQLTCDRRNLLGRDPGDDLTRAARVELDRDVSEEANRKPGRHVDGARRVKQAGDACRQHGSEHLLAKRCDQRYGQQPARRGETGQGGSVGGEHDVGDLLAQEPQLG